MLQPKVEILWTVISFDFVIVELKVNVFECKSKQYIVVFAVHTYFFFIPLHTMISKSIPSLAGLTNSSFRHQS